MSVILRLFNKNTAPKCCGQHMRSQDHMPATIRGIKGKCYRCKVCGRVNINPGGEQMAGSLPRPDMTPPKAPDIKTYAAPCPTCGEFLTSQYDHKSDCQFYPVST